MSLNPTGVVRVVTGIIAPIVVAQKLLARIVRETLIRTTNFLGHGEEPINPNPIADGGNHHEDRTEVQEIVLFGGRGLVGSGGRGYSERHT